MNWKDDTVLDLSKNDQLLNELSLNPNSKTTFTDEPEMKAYVHDLENGFLKLTLSSPEMAFGHKEYPKLMQKLS